MRFDQLPRSDKVEDRRGEGSAGFPMGRAGGVGIGTIIILVLVGWALGINPLYLIGGAEILSGLRENLFPLDFCASEHGRYELTHLIGRRFRLGITGSGLRLLLRTTQARQDLRPAD